MSTPSRILVIDDDLGTCRLMQELLARPDREMGAIPDRRTLYRMAERFGISLE